MTTTYSRFLSGVFLAFLAFFLVLTLATPDRSVSELEKRALQQLPPLSGEDVLSGKFMSDFETYCNDQFALRDAWVALKAGAERLAGKQENNGVYLAQGETLIPRFDAPDPLQITANLGYLDSLAENTSVPVSLSLIPGAVSIWAHKLPDGAPNADQKAILDDIASRAGVSYLDCWQHLWEHREEDIYYRTDHHWTSLGAYYGYVSLLEGLGMEPLPLSAFREEIVSRDFYGTSYSTASARWIPPDSISIYREDPGVEVTSYFTSQPQEGALYCWDNLSLRDQYTFFLGGNQSLCVVKDPQASGPRLLLLRDSYSDSLVPFLLGHFSEIHLIDLRYYRFSIPQYIEENHIDQVVALYSLSNFVSDRNLFTLRNP